MAAYSPGPWHVYEGGNFVKVVMEGYDQYVAEEHYLAGPLCIADVERNQSVDHTSTHEQAMANGHLLSAAPDMAAVCAEFRRLMLVIESSVRNISPEHSDAINALIHRNNAAIAKGLPK